MMPHISSISMFEQGPRGTLVPAFISQPEAPRHALGVEATLKRGITLIKEVLGHADVRTTLIYTPVIGPEARSMMERTWLRVGDARSPDNSNHSTVRDAEQTGALGS